jgi:hypothetical protein
MSGLVSPVKEDDVSLFDDLQVFFALNSGRIAVS